MLHYTKHELDFDDLNCGDLIITANILLKLIRSMAWDLHFSNQKLWFSYRKINDKILVK